LESADEGARGLESADEGAPADRSTPMKTSTETHAQGIHVVARKVYFAIAAALMALLVLTYAAAQIDLGPFNIVVAMAIAFTKAILVVLFFMEVRWSSRLTWLIAGAGLLWLMLLIGGTLDDFMTRAHILPGM
jgi:cytochrome c oxidase subunit 4